MQAEEFSRLAALAKLPDETAELLSLLPRLTETLAFFEKIAEAEPPETAGGIVSADLREDRENPSLSREAALNGAGTEGWFQFESQKGGKEK